MKRRRKGSVRQMSEGRFQVRFTGPRGDRIEKTIDAPNLEAAEAAMELMRQGLHPKLQADGRKREDQSLTLGELHSRYCRVKPLDTPSWSGTETMRLGRFVSYMGPSFPAASVRPKHITSWWQTAEGSRSNATLLKEVTLLSGMFAWACHEDYLTSNPVRDAKKPRPEKPMNLPVVTQHEVEDILTLLTEAGHEYPLVPYYMLGYYQAWRRATTLSLRWENVACLDGERMAARAATKTGTRTFLLAPRVVDWMRDKGFPKRGPVVKTTRGLPCSAESLEQYRKRVGKKLGVELPGAHACRRGFATDALRRGEDIEAIRAVLGHSTEAMTRRYVHLGEVEGQGLVERTPRLDLEAEG